MNDIFESLLSETKNEWATVMSDGQETNVNRLINTGSHSFNALVSGSLYGGIAGNKVIAIAGEESTGKTFFALSICNHFLKENPTGRVFFFESENAITEQMLAERGFDTKRFALVPVETIQQFRTQALSVVNKYLELTKKEREENPILFVLDSLGNLSTQKEMEDISAGKDTKDMTRAQLIRATFRTLTLRLGRANIPLIVTNHVYDNMGGYGPLKEMGGGKGLKYAASTIIFLTKAKDKDGDDVVGVIITATLNKSRLTIENKRVKMLLNYQTGLSPYFGLVDLALKFGIWTKVSTRIEVSDGTKQYEKTINGDPEKFFTQDVMDKLEKACAEEFLYGKTSYTNIEEEQNNGIN